MRHWEAVPNPARHVRQRQRDRRIPAARNGALLRPLGGLAQGDVMLAQKIALETDENRALSIANSFPGPLGLRLPRRRPAEARSSGVRLSPG